MATKIQVGHRFGRLTVEAYEGCWDRANHWTCLCDCGKRRTATTARLRSGNIQSCGCLQAETRAAAGLTHGRSRTRTYNIWAGMISRCRLVHRGQAHRYAGRGIKVCERWERFENFLADMGECPAGMSIEREDSDGDYAPHNCKWATPKQQRANSSQPVPLIAFDGREMNLRDWAKALGLKYHTVYARHRRNLPLEQVFATADLRR